MRRVRWWAQLRFQLLASFALVLLGNLLYTDYAVNRTLSKELPQVELQTLSLRASRLRADLEESYDSYRLLSSKLLSQPPQLAFRIFGSDGKLIEGTSSLPSQPAVVERALREEKAAALIVAASDTKTPRYGYHVLPLYHNETTIGVLEVTEELPPIDRFQESIQQDLLAIALVSMCSILACGMYLGTRFTQSLREIKRQTEAIVQGDFDRRIAIRSNDEIGRISGYLNQMAEDLQQLAQTRNEFFSKVSHELRTPLTIAKGFSSMLRRGKLLPEQERTVAVIDDQIDDLTRLVNDLLDLSRRQHCYLDLRTHEIDCATLIAEVVEQQRQVLREANVTLESICLVDHVQIKGDRQRLHQILGNLIGNASRYCRGKIWLELDANEHTVSLRVRDNGIGIAPEDQSRIFEPFFQSKHGPRGKAGLGLAVARELALAHGGTIEVESTPGAGTTFTIRLPRLFESMPDQRKGRPRFRSPLGPKPRAAEDSAQPLQS
jgi:signal transduction histidine kinase